MSTVRPPTATRSAQSAGPGAACGAGISAIVIDVPDVLYDATVWRRWLFQLLVRMGVARNYREFSRAWDAQLLDVHLGRREHAETLQSFLLSHGLSWAQIDEVEAASRIKRQQLESDVRPLLGVASVLGELCRRQIPLLAWADEPCAAGWLAQRLERLLPAVAFTTVLTSFEIECVQPEPACYRAMLAHLDEEASRVIYVGHEAEHLAAARQAGMVAVAVNHDAGTQADFLLTRIEELPEVVDQCARRAAPRPAAVPACGDVVLHGGTRA